jgi:hypothetical protein
MSILKQIYKDYRNKKFHLINIHNHKRSRMHFKSGIETYKEIFATFMEIANYIN